MDPSRFMLLFGYDTYISSIYTDFLKKNFFYYDSSTQYILQHTKSNFNQLNFSNHN